MVCVCDPAIPIVLPPQPFLQARFVSSHKAWCVKIYVCDRLYNGRFGNSTTSLPRSIQRLCGQIAPPPSASARSQASPCPPTHYLSFKWLMYVWGDVAKQWLMMHLAARRVPFGITPGTAHATQPCRPLSCSNMRGILF